MEESERLCAAHRGARMLMQTQRLHRSTAERLMRTVPLHPAQHRLLLHLSRGKAASQKELASRLGISAAAVTAALNKLESAGLIARDVGDSDSRVRAIRITEAGARLVRDTRRGFAGMDLSLFRGFTVEEIGECLWFFGRMQRNLRGVSDDDLALTDVSDETLEAAFCAAEAAIPTEVHPLPEASPESEPHPEPSKEALS